MVEIEIQEHTEKDSPVKSEAKAVEHKGSYIVDMQCGYIHKAHGGSCTTGLYLRNALAKEIAQLPAPDYIL